MALKGNGAVDLSVAFEGKGITTPISYTGKATGELKVDEKLKSDSYLIKPIDLTSTVYDSLDSMVKKVVTGKDENGKDIEAYVDALKKRESGVDEKDYYENAARKTKELTGTTGSTDSKVAKDNSLKTNSNEPVTDYWKSVGEGIFNLFGVSSTNPDGTENTDAVKQFWANNMDELFLGGLLGGSWGSWDDGNGGGWKNVVSSATKYISEQITDNSKKDWVRTLINYKDGKPQSSHVYGKRGRGSKVMAWGYLTPIQDTVNKKGEWEVDEVGVPSFGGFWNGTDKYFMFHSRSVGSLGGIGSNYQSWKRPDRDIEKHPDPKPITIPESYELEEHNRLFDNNRRTSNKTIYNFISKIMNDPDADQNYFVAWFTVYNKNDNKDQLVKATGMLGWNYFFYLDEIEAAAIKVGDLQKVNYLYESIYTLSKSGLNGDTKFSFRIANDLFLSFRDYVTSTELAYLKNKDTEKKPETSMTVEGRSDYLDLHIAWHAGVDDTENKPKVAEIVLKSVQFTKLSALTFDQAEVSASGTKVEGICRKILFTTYVADNVEAPTSKNDWLKDPETYPTKDWKPQDDYTAQARKDAEEEEERQKKEAEEKKKQEAEEAKQKKEEAAAKKKEEAAKKKAERDARRAEEAKIAKETRDNAYNNPEIRNLTTNIDLIGSQSSSSASIGLKIKL